MTAKRDKDNGHGLGLDERMLNLIHNLSNEKKQQLLDLLIEWQKKEQRGHSRIPCLIAVDYTTTQRVYRDFIHDLSKGGVFIETREPFQIGEIISLTFSLPNSQSHFKIAGKIIRSEEGGIAVQFDTKLSKYQEEIIKKSIDYRE